MSVEYDDGAAQGGERQEIFLISLMLFVDITEIFEM